MTFEQYLRRHHSNTDNWDIVRKPRKCDRPRFARIVCGRGAGRVVQVLLTMDDNLVEARTLTGKVIHTIFHELELEPTTKFITIPKLVS
jgi:hypothetical protein